MKRRVGRRSRPRLRRAPQRCGQAVVHPIDDIPNALDSAAMPLLEGIDLAGLESRQAQTPRSHQAIDGPAPSGNTFRSTPWHARPHRGHLAEVRAQHLTLGSPCESERGTRTRDARERGKELGREARPSVGDRHARGLEQLRPGIGVPHFCLCERF